MSDLKVMVVEEITLPNGNVERASNVKTITGIKQISRRVDTITTFFSGSGIELIRFTDSEAQQTAGSFKKDDVKYVRITHISGSTNAKIHLTTDFSSSLLLGLTPGQSIMFSDILMGSSSRFDTIEEGYTEDAYYRSFTYLRSIKAKAETSDIQLEYLVASR